MVAGGAALVAAGVLLLPRERNAPPSSADPARTALAARLPMKSDPHGSVSLPRAAGPTVAQEPKLSEEERTVILNGIEQAAVTYDAKALPDIERYLLHPDPEVRQAAMNGMVVLGDAAAGPLLRMAAEKAPTPQEAVSLGEAADYVELPPGTFVPKERNAPSTRMPADGKRGERSRPKLAPQPAREVLPAAAE